MGAQDKPLTTSWLKIEYMSNNTSNNKRIAKNTMFLYFRSIILLIIVLYTSRVTLQVLGVQDYGIYQLVGGVVAMFSMLSSTLSSASQRFITYALGEDDLCKQKNVFSTCVTLHLVLGIIVVVLLEIIGIWFLYNKLNVPAERLTTASWVMHFSIATFFVNVIAVPYNSVIIAHEKMSAFAYISILEGILKLSSVFLLIHIEWDKLLVYALFQFLISLILRSIYSIYSRKYFEETKNIKFKMDGILFREMFAFAGWNLLGQGSLVLRNQGMDILLNVFFGVGLNAAKGVSNQVQVAITQLVGNFSNAIKPQLTKSIAEKNYDRAYDLINYGGRIAFALVLVICIPIIMCIQDILSIWLVEVPDYADDMAVLSMIYLLVDVLSKYPVHANLSYGDIRNFQLIQGGIKLLALPIAYVILRLGAGPLTCFWVNIFIVFVCLFPIIMFLKKQINFSPSKYLKNVVLPCFFSFFVALFLCHLIKDNISRNVFFLIPCSFVVSLVVIWLLGIRKKEKLYMLNFLRKKIHV